MPTSQREERGQNPGFEKRVLWPSERQQPCSGSESFGLILLPSGFLPPCVRVQFRRYPKRPPLLCGSHFWFILDIS